MADAEEVEVRSAHESERPGMPRWVKVSLAVVVALVVLFVIGKVTGVGGDHGPQMHGAGSDKEDAPMVDHGDHGPFGHTP